MKSNPMRKCVGCNESREQKELYRIAYHDGSLVFDRDGKADGRGVYICRNMECIEKAKKKRALQRGFRTNLPAEQVEEIFRELEDEQRKSI